MNPQMLEAKMTAQDMMESVSKTVVPNDSAATALQSMEAEDLPLLPVVDPETGAYLGVVLRKAIENGCVRMGHDPATCRVEQHLNRNVPYCMEDEAPGAGFRSKLRPAFVVVVNTLQAPIGFILPQTG